MRKVAGMNLATKSINQISNQGIISDKGSICALLVCMLPFFCTYKSGISGVMLGELIFFIFAIIMLIKSKEYKVTIITSAAIFVLIIVLSELMFIMSISGNGYEISAPIIRTIRFLFYLYIIFHLCYQHFDFNKATKYVKVIGTIASVFLIIQFFYGSISGINILGYIPGLTYEELDMVSKTAVGRYRSFFTEPAYYGQYALVPLIMMLYQKRKELIDYIGIPIITVSIILSTSGSAYVSIAILYILFVLSNTNLSIIKRIILILLIITSLSFIGYFDSYNFTLDRLQNTDAIYWRMNAYEVIGQLVRDNPIVLFTGLGYGNTTGLAGHFAYNTWYPSIAYFFVCLGLPGVISFLYVVYSGHRRGRKTSSSLAFVVIVLVQSVYTDAFHTYWIVYYMPFLYAFGYKKYIK